MSFNYDIIFSESEFKVSFSMTNPEDENNTLYFNVHLKDLKSETLNFEFSFGMTEDSEKIEIKLTGSVTNGKSDIPEISTDSVDVLSMNQEQLNQLVSYIITSASDKLPAKLSKLGIEISKEEILSLNSLVQPTTPTTDETVTDETVTTPTDVSSAEEIQQQYDSIQQQIQQMQQQIQQM